MGVMGRGLPAPCFQCRTSSRGMTPGNRQKGVMNRREGKVAWGSWHIGRSLGKGSTILVFTVLLHLFLFPCFQMATSASLSCLISP